MLMDAFDNLGDHPDRIQQFRKLVVSLAVSGKLEALPTETEAPGDCVLPEILLDQLGVRTAYCVVPLGSIARIEKGRTGIKQAKPGSFPLVVTAAERACNIDFDFVGPAAIVPLVSSTGHGKASLHRLHYQDGKFALGTILAAILPIDPDQISARFIFEYLTAFKDELLVSHMIGTANVSLSVGKLSEVPIPMVPQSLQRRVDELMALCDQLDTVRTRRESTRDRLAAASFAHLGPVTGKLQ